MGVQQEDDPPPYSSRYPSPSNDNSETMRNDVGKERTEPLSRFLAFVLADDYKTFGVRLIPARERLRFLCLSQAARKIPQDKKDGFYEHHERIGLQNLHYYITLPAEALGLPVDTVREMLVSYPFDLTPVFGHYARRFRHGFGDLRVLATKLLVDREILIDAVVDRPRAREKLKRANKAIEEKWFISLRSPDEYELTAHGMEFERRLHDPNRRSRWFGSSRCPENQSASRTSRLECALSRWWLKKNGLPSPEEDIDFVARYKETQCRLEST